jgi:SAM-dependent methyltransferase
MIKSLLHAISKRLNLPNRAWVRSLVYEELSRCTQQIERGMMQQRRLMVQRSTPGKAPAPTRIDGLNDTLEMIKQVAPAAYNLWLQCQKAGEQSYEGTPLDSCSVSGHVHAELFRDFLVPYLHGAVLDVGCGPQPVPEYLQGYPLESIAGLDPIGSQEDHPFEFYRGLVESLPWENSVFDAVIIGTSMDHFILLDKALDEMHRVMTEDGHLVIWVSFTKGAPAYDPYQDSLKSFDKYHLFHFDQPWFEELLSTRFKVVERFDLYYPGYRHVPEAFYALVPL